jgi:hypothetical protein
MAYYILAFCLTRMDRKFRDRTSHNMGFSAMLAEEYILIVPFAYQLHQGAKFLRNVN